jgi:uncharacterized protein (TIGR03437 family)
MRSKLALFTLLAACVPAAAQQVWRPAVRTSWQWQLTTPVDQSADAGMFDIDLFDNDASVVTALHARGRKVVCYLSAGTYESWRPDAAKFPDAVKGRALEDFADERWLDIRRLDVLGPILEARLDLCKSKGFDGVEPDNVDAYTNRSGFPLTAADQLKFNRFLAQAAHARGLSAGLKNDLDQVPDLLADFDWALNEQCFEYSECDPLKAFVAAGKAVFQVEYNLDTTRFCPQANAADFNSLRKKIDLDAWVTPCRTVPADTGPVVTAVASGASYRGEAVSAGEIVALFGSGLGPATLAGWQFNATGRLTDTLDGTRILFNGVAAPLLYVQDRQSGAIVPFGVAGAAVSIEVERNGARSAAVSLPLAGAHPALFTANASGTGQAAAVNPDNSINSLSAPVPPGSVIALYAAGAGIMAPQPPDGSVSRGTLPKPVQDVKVTIGGVPAGVVYAGAAPETVAGLLQVNARVPSGLAAGPAAVSLSVGNAASQPGVTIAVGAP